MRRSLLRFPAFLLVVASVASCGLFVSFDDYDASVDGSNRSSARFAVRGTIDGLVGVPAMLRLNSGSPVEVTRDGEFAFPAVLADGDAFAVTVDGGPSWRSCSVEEGTGVIQGADAVGAAIHCVDHDTELTGLMLSEGDLVPTFAPGTLDYAAKATIGRLLPFATVIATARAAAARIAIAGQPLTASGAPSQPIELRPGQTAIDIVVSAPGRPSQRHYTIDVRGAPDPVDARTLFQTKGSYFGNAVAVSGDTLVVGAQFEPIGTSFKPGGAVYVFKRRNRQWSLDARLTASNTNLDASFGAAVAISGDTLVVGAPGEAGGATGVNPIPAPAPAEQPKSGAVYVFVRSASGWSQEAYVKASNTGHDAAFGASVALSGRRFIVGAPAENSPASGIGGSQNPDGAPSAFGAAYVFSRGAAGWSQEAYVKASNSRQYAQFGVSVAISGDTLAVGASGESSGVGTNQADTTAPRAGAVYLCVRGASGWTQAAYVKASNPRSSARFGAAVALSGDTLAVGSPDEASIAKGIGGDQADVSAPLAGAAYVFSRSSAGWPQEAYVKASNTQPGAAFGSSVALSGQTLAIGSPLESSNAAGLSFDAGTDDRSLAGAGAAYVFRRGASWSQLAYVKAPIPRDGAWFGASVGLSASVLAVGEPTNPGRAYAY